MDERSENERDAMNGNMDFHVLTQRQIVSLESELPSACKMCEIGKRPQKMLARAAGTGGRPHGSRP